MEKKYFVKTRNWKCVKPVRWLLDVSHLWGTERGDGYTDGDGKFYLETDNKFLALFTWMYFMALEPLTRGWTYCLDTTKHGIDDLNGRNIALV